MGEVEEAVDEIVFKGDGKGNFGNGSARIRGYDARRNGFRERWQFGKTGCGQQWESIGRNIRRGRCDVR